MSPTILGLLPIFKGTVENIGDACADNIRSWGSGMESVLNGIGRRIGGPPAP